MKATIALDIGAMHLRATLTPKAPGWGLRAARAVGVKLRRTSKPVESTESTVTETGHWTPGATRDQTLAALLEAAAQALQALRARHPASLDGCRLTVRTGVSSSYVGVAAMDVSSSSAHSDHPLRSIAKALSQEALGAEAAGHEVRWRIQADQAHLCVITLDAALIAGLQALAQAQQMKLASCQPAIAALLDGELEHSRRQRDARTLVWTERDAAGRRHAALTFVRVVNGSAVNAWRTLTPAPSNAGDPWLQPALDRFLIASGAALDEQVVPCTWPPAPRDAPELAA
ncbi:hypothetical protein [Polaromonas sp. YR568]|uniref:hypothetical protein n=1 Tax=Polaromonas sp. YR568 TaxID=1855301 RepID=UPI00398BFF83